MDNTVYRHELKHYINFSDWMQLRARLKHLAKPDMHAGEDGGYFIRSLYFDNYRDKAVVEKLSGQSRREKYRIRYYNHDPSFIRLERKSKLKRLASKETASLSAGDCMRILRNDYSALDTGNELIAGFVAKISSQQLRPRTIVDYHREAYTYAPGNVRITIDSNIRMSENIHGFLEPALVTIPSANAIILEIKYDEFLPDIMRDAVQLGDRRETEFSKYIVSRMVT